MDVKHHVYLFISGTEQEGCKSQSRPLTATGREFSEGSPHFCFDVLLAMDARADYAKCDAIARSSIEVECGLARRDERRCLAVGTR